MIHFPAHAMRIQAPPDGKFDCAHLVELPNVVFERQSCDWYQSCDWKNKKVVIGVIASKHNKNVVIVWLPWLKKKYVIDRDWFF